mmetsp:Transcript_138794/g.431763  ORF Transcript_138794/g.431763 Transcript_138794/m.431763 type:complete len:329 (+) Transcript_138794:36-1022(+)|eukprot:CAMPEP_0204521980 /NCGR_PEP_ID=MMETSP0661-20131031/6069_1 /ASSEMBLY_ACC=CAM_ASM_000606 /TAXON_ID=109239 /ORGANISM="Alexandrium margalefi, Strain AMGDE01CS-322" /LENGTH=328 /DNA_ID=CAMNT_0051527609 /DNA_START=36 /DNA_END=1022 /DNA_ORIENTATION=+
MALYDKITSGEGTILLDGEVGGFIRCLCPEECDTKLVPASVCWERPSVIREVHLKYIAAGANIITTNTYATVRARLAKELGAPERWEEAVKTSLSMAKEARSESGKDVLIAGSLPPLAGSYRPDNVGLYDDILKTYREHVAVMAEHVDLFLCETMTTGEEARAAATAAKESGKPVWISWNCKEDGAATLRSGETLQQAWDKVADLKPEAALVNCVTPETVSVAVPQLKRLGARFCGGYGNAFSAIPEGWTNKKAGIGALGERTDMTPEAYADFVARWREAGASIVGGCCKVGPDHISKLRQHIDDPERPAKAARKEDPSSETAEEGKA